MTGTPSTYQHLQDVFGVVDEMNANKFASYFSPSAQFIFGNAPAATGPENIAEMVAQFFGAIKAINHVNLQMYELDNFYLVRGEAKYTRHNGSVLQVPFANTIALNDQGLITGYQIYIDNTELFQ